MRVIHVFRTPVGGLFRHVRDVVRGHCDLGIDSGVICDSTTGGDAAAQLLKSIEPFCALGVRRIPISRLPGLGDIGGARSVAAACRDLKPDVIHGHGAKGGLYGRLAARMLRLPSLYTPHGGSLHYDWGLSAGSVFLAAEAGLQRLGSADIFVCEFERKAFEAKIGLAGKPFRIIHNGLWPEEISEVPPAPGANDVLFVGELRKLKGVDVLLDALALAGKSRQVTATIVGSGEDQALFETKARELGLSQSVNFAGRLPALQAFPLGRLFVMPSRAESFPYVVLEAAAAGLPIIASKVGGIPEVLPEDRLVPPGDADALARSILVKLARPEALQAEGRANAALVARRFDARRMCGEIAAFYQGISRSWASS